MRDRVAQRSFVDVAGRVLDAEAAEASFGYRRGRSWLDALRQVEQHRDSGLRWVSRADIHRFFDEVDHAVLEDRLARTFVAEPAVVNLAMKWATAPLLGPNGIAERHRGLPLGAPVSAVLANHVLADVDVAVDGAAGRMVRYADDICVCCPDEEGALRARWQLEMAVDAVGLRLNAAKSYVSSFDRGFSFLGWVFSRHHGWEESPTSTWVHPMSVGRTGGR